MNKHDKIFWSCFAVCGLIVAGFLCWFLNSRSLLAGLTFVCSLFLAVVPVMAANLFAAAEQ